ncbi:MAG: monovalent cation/H(+) antiporter subunit G [Alphaproteobacteria bacterium]
MEILREIASWTLLVSGGAFCMIGALGLLRLPDVYARMHAAGITDSLGAGLILAGLMVQGGFSLVTVKLFLILMFLLFTNPTSTYALANAAYRRGLAPLLGGGTSENEDGESSKP